MAILGFGKKQEEVKDVTAQPGSEQVGDVPDQTEQSDGAKPDENPGYTESVIEETTTVQDEASSEVTDGGDPGTEPAPSVPSARDNAKQKVEAHLRGTYKLDEFDLKEILGLL